MILAFAAFQAVEFSTRRYIRVRMDFSKYIVPEDVPDTAASILLSIILYTYMLSLLLLAIFAIVCAILIVCKAVGRGALLLFELVERLERGYTAPYPVQKGKAVPVQPSSAVPVQPSSAVPVQPSSAVPMPVQAYVLQATSARTAHSDVNALSNMQLKVHNNYAAVILASILHDASCISNLPLGKFEQNNGYYIKQLDLLQSMLLIFIEKEIVVDLFDYNKVDVQLHAAVCNILYTYESKHKLCTTRREAIHAHVVCMELVLNELVYAGINSRLVVDMRVHVSTLRISYGLGM